MDLIRSSCFPCTNKWALSIAVFRFSAIERGDGASRGDEAIFAGGVAMIETSLGVETDGPKGEGWSAPGCSELRAP